MTAKQIKIGDKTKFFWTNFIKGFIWTLFIVGAYVVIKHYFGFSYEEAIKPYLENRTLIYSIYTISELMFGIIPPEFFMIWGLSSGRVIDYIGIVSLLAVISYSAGFVGFLFGSFLKTTVTFRYIRKRFLSRYQPLVVKYGAFLILVAAMTPLPFSAIAMLTGSFHFPVKKYLFWSLSRFLRFALYAIIVWEANML